MEECTCNSSGFVNPHLMYHQRCCVCCTAGDGEEEKEEEEARDGEDKQLAANRVKSVTFPTYVEPNVKDDMVSH